MIVGVTANVVALFDDETGLVELTRDAFRKHGTGKARADDKEIEL